MVESINNAAPLKSWITYDADDHFPLENIPFGVFVNPTTGKPSCCTRIGGTIIDLAVLEHERLFDGPIFSVMDHHVFCEDTLNEFMAEGKDARIEARQTLQSLFAEGSTKLKDSVKKQALFDAGRAEMRLPVFIRDYTDFYSSKNHAYNVGVMFRGPDNALQPNWLHLPVGYHGRASSIVVSGTQIRRPKGQVSADKLNPTWSQCNRLDLELEMGTYIGKANKLGEPIKVNDAKDHVFGYCLLNDWSARDLQVWEYVPLGPFNAKNFASSVSPWVITPEALAPFKTPLPAQQPALLPYLQDEDLSAYDISLEMLIQTPQMKEPHLLATSNMKHLYYSVAQTIAHHSVTGCNMSVGDMLGSGTISGTEKSQYGSLVELCWGGKEPI